MNEAGGQHRDLEVQVARLDERLHNYIESADKRIADLEDNHSNFVTISRYTILERVVLWSAGSFVGFLMSAFIYLIGKLL